MLAAPMEERSFSRLESLQLFWGRQSAAIEVTLASKSEAKSREQFQLVLELAAQLVDWFFARPRAELARFSGA